MRAAVLRGGHMILRDDVDDPAPAPGQVLVQLKACGICGSDLHFAKHGGTMVELIVPDAASIQAFGINLMDPGRSAGAAQAGLAEGNAQAASLRAVWLGARSRSATPRGSRTSPSTGIRNGYASGSVLRAERVRERASRASALPSDEWRGNPNAKTR